MAVYDGERYLREAINSILNQSFNDFEFLIINDGSTDRTQEIILSYNDPRLRLIDNPHNLGLTKSLNCGLKQSSGQFVARQDADDISEPERLAKQVAFLEKHTEVALLGTWYKEIDSQGTFIENARLPCDDTGIRWSLLFFCPFVHSSVMLRRAAVLEHIGFYNEAFVYSQDYELWTRIARLMPVANLNQYLVKLRTTPTSMTATYGDRTKEGHRIRIAKMCALLNWDHAKIIDNEAQYNSMTSLLFSDQIEFSLQQVNWATDELLRLQTIFCQHFQIGATDSQSHRAKLCAHISWRLFDIARCYSSKGNATDARQLVNRARRLYPYWPILPVKRHLWFSFRLLMKLSMVKSIWRFSKKRLTNVR